MAIRKAEDTPVVATGRKLSKMVPAGYKQATVCRCRSAKFGPSANSGFPQIVTEWEILVPAEYTSDYDGNTYDLTSLTFKIYIGLNEVDKKGNATDNIGYLTRTLLPLLGLGSQIDDENPLFDASKNPTGIQLEGILATILLEATEREEQRKKADGTYEPVLDFNKQPIKRGWQFGSNGMVDKKAILGKADFAQGVAESRPV